jgi:hypothetical protein
MGLVRKNGAKGHGGDGRDANRPPRGAFLWCAPEPHRPGRRPSSQPAPRTRMTPSSSRTGVTVMAIRPAHS